MAWPRRKRVEQPQRFLETAPDPVPLDGAAGLFGYGETKPRLGLRARENFRCDAGLSWPGPGTKGGWIARRAGPRRLGRDRARRRLQCQPPRVKTHSLRRAQEVSPSSQPFRRRHGVSMRLVQGLSRERG